MKVTIAAGGTAGHLFPAVEVARTLRDQGHSISFLGVIGSGSEYLKSEGFSYQELRGQGLQGLGLLKNLSAVMSLLQATFKARKVLSQNRPNVIAGFGGYPAFPVVLAGWLLRIPTVIHEQNVLPGRANKMLAKIVDKVAVTFPESRQYLSKDVVVTTGCPIRNNRHNGSSKIDLKDWNFDRDRKTILVFGGSQGSQRINTLIPGALQKLNDTDPLQVVHISGHRRLAEIEKRYASADFPNQLVENYQSMSDLYAIADVVICRAGAATVNELVSYSRLAVLIPYPHAHGHQVYNAQVLKDRGLAEVVLESSISETVVVERLRMLLAKSADSEGFQQLQEELNINRATESLAEEILAIS